MLVEHGIDDVNKRLVAGEETVTSAQEIALQQSFAEVFGEHLDHATILTQVVVARHGLGHPRSIGDVEDTAQSVRDHFVGSEQQEVFGIGGDHIAHPGAEDSCGFALGGPGSLHVHGVVAKVGELEVDDQDTPIGDRIVAHASLAPRRQGNELFDRAPVVVEELFRSVGLHPVFHRRPVRRVGTSGRNGNLVSSEGSLDLLAVNHRRPGPAFWRAQHDHRPSRKAVPTGPIRRVDLLDVIEAPVEHARERLVRLGRVGSEVDGHLARVIPVPTQQLVQVLRRDASEDGRVRDLVPVQVQDREDRAITVRIDELVHVPTRRQRSSLGFAVTDDTEDRQVGVVQGGSVAMEQRVSEFAPLVK